MSAKPRWHAEPGQDFDLREYVGGAPTGRVANIRVPGEHVRRVPGQHVQLVIDRRQVTLVEQAEHRGVLLRVPWESFLDARLHDEPGTARLRLDLTIRLQVTAFPVSLWFDARWRSELARLVDRITPDAVLPLLDVRCAPASDEWLVFLPGECSTEVLRRTTAG